MATEQGLRLLLTADVALFERALSDAQKAASNAANGIVASSKQIQGAGTYIDKLQGNLKSLVDGLKTGETRFVAFSKAIDKIPPAPKQITDAGAALTSFSRIAQDAPYGLNGVGNNITNFAEQFEILVKKTGSAGGAFKALGATIAGPGGIVAGISLLIAGLTALTQKYGSVGAAIDILTSNYSAAQKLQMEYNKAVAEGVSQVAGEISVVKGYLAIAQDETVSRKQRLAALKEVKKEYPGYLDNINLENVSSAKATEAVDRLTQALIRKAKVQGAQDLIAAEQKKIFEAQTTSLASQATVWQQLGNAILSVGNPAAQLAANIQSGLKTSMKTVGDAGDKINSLEKIIGGLLKQDADAGVIGIGDKDTKKVKTAADVIKELDKDMKALAATFTTSKEPVQSLIDDQIKRLSQALGELTRVGVGPADKLFTDIQARVNALQGQIEKGKKVTIPITADVGALENIAPRVKEQTTNAVKAGTEVIRNNLIAFQNSFANGVNNAIQSGITSIVSGIGQAVGNLLSGTSSIQDAFKGIIGLFGSFLKQLGEAMIAAGTATLIAKVFAKNPVTAIAAGIAAVAAGVALQNTIKSAPTSFATGGTQYGPGLALIGDNAVQKEHILSDLQLQKIAQGAGIGGGGGILEARVEGTDLILLLNRAGANISRQ